MIWEGGNHLDMITFLFHASLAVKIGVAQFLNTGIIVLLVNSTLFQFTNLMGNSGLNDFDRE